MPDEILLPFPVPRERVRDATHFRSTWLSSSLSALRERSLFDRYLAALPPEHHASILETVAGMWLPIEVALAHYNACNSLELSRREMFEIGAEVTRRVHGTSLALAIRLARQTGVTPWSILVQLQRLWERIWQGGAIAVYKRGPKEAVVEIVRWRCAGIPYVRHTIPAVVLGVTEMFCTKAYVTDVPSMGSSSSMGVKLQWV